MKSSNIHNRPGDRAGVPVKYPERPIAEFSDKSAIDTFLRGGPEPIPSPEVRPAAPAPAAPTTSDLGKAIRGE